MYTDKECFFPEGTDAFGSTKCELGQQCSAEKKERVRHGESARLCTTMRACNEDRAHTGTDRFMQAQLRRVRVCIASWERRMIGPGIPIPSTYTYLYVYPTPAGV